MFQVTLEMVSTFLNACTRNEDEFLTVIVMPSPLGVSTCLKTVGLMPSNVIACQADSASGISRSEALAVQTEPVSSSARKTRFIRGSRGNAGSRRLCHLDRSSPVENQSAGIPVSTNRLSVDSDVSFHECHYLVYTPISTLLSTSGTKGLMRSWRLLATERLAVSLGRGFDWKKACLCFCTSRTILNVKPKPILTPLAWIPPEEPANGWRGSILEKSEIPQSQKTCPKRIRALRADVSFLKNPPRPAEIAWKYVRVVEQASWRRWLRQIAQPEPSVETTRPG
jgi:hypothetical protein